MKVPDELSFNGGGTMGSQAFSGFELIKKPWKRIGSEIFLFQTSKNPFNLLLSTTFEFVFYVFCTMLGELSGNTQFSLSSCSQSQNF